MNTPAVIMNSGVKIYLQLVSELIFNKLNRTTSVGFLEHFFKFLSSLVSGSVVEEAGQDGEMTTVEEC